jgi:hypothetical protein
MSYFGVSTRNGVGLSLGTVPSLANTPLSYRLAPSLNLVFAGSDALSPAITFTRTTNATLTGSNGLIQNAPMNLLTFSEQFDNAVWTKQNATVTANSTAAPNGTLTADALIETAVNGQHQFYALPGLAVQTYTRSIYAKANGRTQFQFEQESGGNTRFTLSGEGTALALGSNTASITAVGNGWYRCTSTFTVTASFGLYTLLYNGTSTSYTGDGVSGIFFWGAQVESNATATTYNPTTVKNLLGFTENFDNAAWTKSNAFVQTNLLLYSEMFADATWSKVNSTITANSTTAPDGTQTADTFIPTVTAGTVTQTGISKAAASITYTFSFYAKAAGFTSLRAFVFGSSNANRGDATFDLSNETVSSVASVGGFTNTSATITNANNGWYRCTITTTSDTTTALAATFRFDGTVNGTSGFFLWGAQIVQGATPGDYKATYAAAAAVGYTDIYGQPFAQKLVENTANASHYVTANYTFLAAPHVYSIYVKPAGRNFTALECAGVGYAYFDLVNGTVGTNSGLSSAVITPIGSGWYRCSILFTPAAGSRGLNVYSALADNTATYTGDGTSGIYIFGAQLSDSASVDPYVYQPVAAPASTAYYGPRFDYDPVTLAPKGLLIEEQRTNLLLNSSLAGTSLATQNVTVTAVAHTLSFYGTGTVTLSGTSTAGPLVGTGAYPARSTLTFTPTAGTLTLTVTGDVQFAQLEIGAFATSFIPSAASQVTRAADSASMIGNNFARWYTQGVGTLFADSTQATTTANTFALLSAGVNIIRIGSGKMDVFVAGTATALITGTVTSGSIKQAGAYQVNDFAISTNGGAVSTDTSGAVPFVDSATFSSAVGNSVNGTIKRIGYWPRRLANSELQAVTA